MISEQQQEQASLYVLGALTAAEKDTFETGLRADADLRELVQSLERATGLVARAVPQVAPPPELRHRIMQRIEAGTPQHAAAQAASNAAIASPGSLFIAANDSSGWKDLPVRGASIKLLSVDRERGYAVLLGRLAPGSRYPAHTHVGAENLFILTGDLNIDNRRLGPGDFHHSAAGTAHPENHSIDGCTLLAVLSVDHALAKFAMA